MQRFTENGPTHTTLANRTLSLLEVKPVGGLAVVVGGQEYDNLDFEWMDGELLWDTDISMEELKARQSFFHNGYMLDNTQKEMLDRFKANMRSHIEEMETYRDPTIEQEETINKLHQTGIQKLVHILHGMNYDTLTSLKTELLTGNMNDEIIKAKRDIFIELLPIVGTWPATLVARDIIMNDNLKSDMDTAKMITAIPFHVKPVKIIAEEFFKLISMRDSKVHLQRPLTWAAIDLTFAHLVRRTCIQRDTEEECFKTLHINEFIRRFDSLPVDDLMKQKHMMMVLTNFQESEILEKKMKEIAWNIGAKKYKPEIRSHAVFALMARAISKGKEKEYFLPLFLDRTENHELRISAFAALIQGGPDFTTLQKIMRFMIYETDNEVFNFVYTAFEKLAMHENEPCQAKMRDFARYFIKYWKTHMWQKPKYSIGLSKYSSTSFRQEKYGYAGAVDVFTIGNSATVSPLSVMVDIRSQRYRRITMNEMGFFIRMEGVAQLVVEKVMALTQSGNMEIDKLKAILFADMNIRERKNVPAKLDLVFLVRGIVVMDLHVDDTGMLGNINYIKTIMRKIMTMRDIYDFNKRLSFAWQKFLYEQPTDFGVPMAFASGGMYALGLAGKIKMEKMTEPGLKGELELKLHMNTDKTDLMMVVHPDQVHRFTIQQDRTSKHQLRTTVATKLDTLARRLEMTFKVPEVEHPLSLLFHSRTFIFTGRKVKLFENPHILVQVRTGWTRSSEDWGPPVPPVSPGGRSPAAGWSAGPSSCWPSPTAPWPACTAWTRPLLCLTASLLRPPVRAGGSSTSSNCSLHSTDSRTDWRASF